jgi:glutamate-ammonia-ligase adenylyltransferase
VSDAPPLAEAIAEAPLCDEACAGAKLDDLAAAAAQAGATGLAEHLRPGKRFRDLLAALSEHSPFLWRLALADPTRLADLAERPADKSLRDILERQEGYAPAFAAGTVTREEVARGLRRNRDALALLAGLADLGGVWDVDEATAALSDFADRSVRSAVGVVLYEARTAGRLKLDAAAPEEGSGLVVLALGKHGARELNYSSDIDLVVFFDPEAPALGGSGDGTTIYSRIAREVAKLLQERTHDGYVHRVDYRLRPDPGSTPVAVSLPAAYSYYETLGQNWERAAFIKARPIAGDLALGKRFLADLTPFIWRKYFDFASIADIHAMKRQIHAVRGHEEVAVAGHDIKLGRGGIREVEFFVQTQQLVFGGRRPALRGRRTLDMLGALHDEGWITAAARDEMADSYRFLRRIEHRLQMIADEQTQRLPSDPEALEGFARFAGYPSLDAFSAELTAHAHRVQAHYALLFEEGPELASDLGSLVFTGSGDDPETLATLARLGFRQPEVAAETVRGWHFGRRAAVTSARAREVLTELVPALLSALGGTADPDGALATLDRAFGRMPAAVELMTILISHDRLRLLFADLLGTAPRLADTVAQTPHVLDAVIDPSFAAPARETDTIEAQLRGLVGPCAHFEEFLDRLRDAARQLRFVTGARMLSDILAPADAGRAYAAIAEAAIRAALDQVRSAFETDHGRLPDGRLAVLGLGRLGIRDLTAASDLDLVVLYDFDPDRRTSDGPRPLDAVVYYTRLTQRLVSALTAPTRRGRLYDIDLRLRPSGGKGPVATQFRGFVSYQREEAELWEHMALARARVVAGDEAFRPEVEAAVRAVLIAPRRRADVVREARAMRSLIAREKGEDDPFDVKLARGGLTDIDFIAQVLLLAHACEHPDPIGLSTPETLSRAAALHLLDGGDATALREAHRLLDDIQHWQRLTVEGRFDAAMAAPSLMTRLAGIAGVPDPGALREHLREVGAEVRGIFERVLAE